MKDKHINIFLDDATYSKLKERADLEFRSVPKTVELAIAKFLDEDK